MAGNIPHKDPLDISLDNIQKTALSLTEVVRQQAERLQESSYEFPVMIRSIESLTKSLEKIIELAPFLGFRQDFAAIEKARDALYQSTEFIGENRTLINQFLLWYQTELLRNTGQIPESQMQLL